MKSTLTRRQAIKALSANTFGALLARPLSAAGLGLGKAPLKLLLDTDIGADIDDEMTLIYLLNSPDIDLRGVTTVFGNPEARARSARAIIDVMDRGVAIPVYAGAAQNLSQQPGMTDASRFIVQSLRKADGPRNILVTGGYTNVARAVQAEPDLARSRMETLYLMGFSLVTMTTHHNATGDLQATDILLKSGIPLSVLPAEIGWECQMTQEEYDEILASDAPQIVHIKQSMINWVNHVRTRPNTPIPDYLPRPYDTLAAMTIKNPELFQWKRGTIEIVSSDGKINFTESADGLHEIVVGVDRGRAMGLHHKRLLAWPGTLTPENPGSKKNKFGFFIAPCKSVRWGLNKAYQQMNETPRSNPTGNQSCTERFSQPPEASFT